MTDILKAIVAINPNALVSVNSEDIDQITWLGGTTPIAKADIQAKITELQTAHNAQDYARARADAYPSIGDQLDMLWHAIDADATLKSDYADFHTAIKAVKDANPK
jgi:hypothetical protein